MQVQGTTRDITDRVKARKELQQTEEKFSIAFSLSPVSVLLDHAGRGTHHRRQSCFLRDSAGYSKDEVIGRTSVELGLWAESDTRERTLRHCSRVEGSSQTEIAMLPRSGEPHTVLLSVVPIETRCGAVPAFDGHRHHRPQARRGGRVGGS